jgi:hypothetical protein
VSTRHDWTGDPEYLFGTASTVPGGRRQGVVVPPTSNTQIYFKEGPRAPSITPRCQTFLRVWNPPDPTSQRTATSENFMPDRDRDCNAPVGGVQPLPEASTQAGERALGVTHWFDAFLNDRDDFWRPPSEQLPESPNAKCWVNRVSGGEHDGKSRLQCRFTTPGHEVEGFTPPGGYNFPARDPDRP